MPTPYLAPTLRDQGYTGANGTTPYKPATTQHVNTLQDLYNNSPAANAPQVVSATATVININFDGTKNNGEFPASGESATNVDELSKLQMDANVKDNTIYLPGGGAQIVPAGTLDANGNGMTDAGEFKTLTALGIANINLHSDGQVRDAGTLLANSGSDETDATVMGNAVFTRTDGSTGVAADTMLAYALGHATQAMAPVVDTSTTDAQTAEIIRQALLFNQICNTATANDIPPLGFVPIQPEVQLHDVLVAPQDASHPLMQSA